MRKNIVAVLHAVLASSGVGALADALTRLHGAAQAGGAAAGLGALAVATVSAALHSREAQKIAHQIGLDAAKLATPGVVTAVEQMKADVAKIVPVDQVEKMIGDAVAKVEQEIPAPARVAVDDIRPLVEEALSGMFARKAAPPEGAPAPVEPAPVVGAPVTPAAPPAA